MVQIQDFMKSTIRFVCKNLLNYGMFKIVWCGKLQDFNYLKNKFFYEFS
jgi:hypothetical protein